MNLDRLAIVAAAAAASLAVGVHAGLAQSPPPAFDITLKPVRDGGPYVTAIAVRETISGLPADKPLTLSAPVVYAGVRGIADRVQGLALSDAQVPVPLTASCEKGVRFDHAAWKAFLTRELGPDAATQWEKVVIDGELFTPGEHAFGPCFERKARTYEFQGQSLEGFAFERVAGPSDAKCLAW